jgi:ABC-type branched-subunit amino acid transport system substrate-binding protein
MLALLLAVMLVLLAKNGKAEPNMTATYTLGFLAPTADSAMIPASLATEWISAFNVALEVLNSERTYILVPQVQPSQCDWQLAERGAETIVLPITPPVIGVVGPECTAAAMSASRSLMFNNISLVSFAATAETLSNRGLFPNFFRTVYGDMHQAAALVASIMKLQMQKVTIVVSQSYYSSNLGQNVQKLVNGSTTVRTVTVAIGDKSLIDAEILESALNSIEADEVVLLAVEPLQARDIWQKAYKMGKTGYPYWYLGADGVTAFDLADVNTTDPSMLAELVGEIGVSPFGGDFSSDNVCNKFYSHWRKKNYPGLISDGQNRTRSYVPYLIDAVTAYFKVIDNLIEANISVNALTVFQAFNGSGPGTPVFEGCSGLVSFDPETGSRNATAQIPIFEFVSLIHGYWEAKGQIRNETFQSLQPLTRPGSVTGSTYNANSSTIMGTLVGLAAVLGLILGISYYLLRRKKKALTRSESMDRIWDH